ncbi:unnamed protein product [Parascedosporium putredinis]|uniref:non-specific serine/threonine protein kinase n=1 Tax=Parascedosporium putredinis TaxID=1442378 RepID=A0A9P1GZ66_9PEZI|nr:unnamed protein product [Parascedosporium putredinis]CAI7991357.1 unnamed protein product [Parascedosporium putredinis]
MASRGFEDEELTMSLSSQGRRKTTGNGQSQGQDDGSVLAPARGVDSPRGPLREKIKTEQRIGAYKVLKTLGEGSFGKVKLAIHHSTNQPVALKIIARKKLISRDMAGRVEREIEYLQLLRHPTSLNFVPPFTNRVTLALRYTVIKTPAEIIMVLEYAGGELFDYIVQNGRMKEAEARRFFQQMICAVEYCHRHKIVHRDLKPENLLLDDNLNVKIADFGLSNIMTDGNFLKTSCGSPNYAAPEVIGGKLYAGPEVDVWSCGVILYVLLAGRLPFDDDHIPSLFAKIAKGAYTIPQWMPTGAVNLIKKMLVVNPVQRVTIEDIKDDPWFMTDLPPYLQGTAEEFLNTGVQEKLHEEVTEKISKTMGYGKKDVQEALESEEPSTIKDAYLIFRENKLMEVNRCNKPNAIYVIRPLDCPHPCEPSQKSKPVRWQFGIRSRNAPWEALLCIHKALNKLGATYLPDEDYDKVHGQDCEDHGDDEGLESANGSFADDYSGAPLRRCNHSSSSVDPSPRYKLPADPWRIKVRWESNSLGKGSFSRLDNQDGARDVRAFVAMHLDIQIYEMEPGVYLVDFKCSGYETHDGILLDEKEIMSPFPFLDMAARLIMQLAEAD